MSDTQLVNNSILYVAATAVYVPTARTFTLTETTGGGARTGNIAVGVYTKTTFNTLLQTQLNTISANAYTYTVTVINPTGYTPLPDAPTQYGTGFGISFNGAGTFLISFPDPL
jgi:hypothetical protein